MNDQQANNDELLKNKLLEINPVDERLSATRRNGKKFPGNSPEKKTTKTKDESSSYDDLHYGNYE